MLSPFIRANKIANPTPDIAAAVMLFVVGIPIPLLFYLFIPTTLFT